MATKKCLRTTALFLILLVLATQILASQGRPLKEHTSTQRRELFQGGEATKGMVQGAVSVSEEARSAKPMVVVDDIRPTAPGHSPGVGHMLVDEKQRGKLIG